MSIGCCGLRACSRPAECFTSAASPQAVPGFVGTSPHRRRSAEPRFGRSLPQSHFPTAVSAAKEHEWPAGVPDLQLDDSTYHD